MDRTQRQPRRDVGEEARKLQFLYRNNPKKAMRQVRQEQSPLCEVPPDTVAAHFDEVFAERLPLLDPPPEACILPATQRHDPDLVVTIDHNTITNRLHHVSNTAPGPDRIKYALLKRTDPGAQLMHEIFRRCLEQRQIPAAWKISRTILLYKKGDRDDLSNWRPISLSSCLYKLYTGILADRLGKWALRTKAVSPIQKGFMPAEGCLEHNFILQQAIDDARLRGADLTITWLDLRNAFGSVPHSVITFMLQQHGVHPVLVEVIQDAYASCSTTFVTASGETRQVQMLAGVKQGDPLSPIVFNLALESLIRSTLDLKEDHGYKLLEHQVNALAYADDLVLLAKSPQNMQALLNTIGEVATWSGLHFNAAKCATLALSKKKAIPSVRTTVQGQPIPVLTEGDAYQHLGVPTGLRVDQTPDKTIEAMLKDIGYIENSALSDWQKLDAIRTFVIPQAQFTLLTATVKKTAFDGLDKEIKRVAKRALHLPLRASNEVIYLPNRQGGANIPQLSELIDAGVVTRAFKMLTCPDSLVRNIAEASLQRAVTTATRTDQPPSQLVVDFLSGAQLPKSSHSFTTIWSAARNASRRLASNLPGFCWEWTEELQTFTIKVPKPESEPDCIRVDASTRKQLHAAIRTGQQHRHHLRLKAKLDQGRVYEASSRNPESNHYIRAGKYTRFCDWRFIHRARLSVLPLRCNIRKPGVKECRVCHYPQETTAHALCHCMRFSRTSRNRHRSVIKNLINFMEPSFKSILRVEQRVPGTNHADMPDMVLLDNDSKKAVVIDITCPFENNYQALNQARAEKINKYSPLAETLQKQGLRVDLDAVVVGALGTWDNANERVLNLLGIPENKRKMVKRLIVSDVIRWSRDLYCEFIDPEHKRQYKEDLKLPVWA